MTTTRKWAVTDSKGNYHEVDADYILNTSTGNILFLRKMEDKVLPDLVDVFYQPVAITVMPDETPEPGWHEPVNADDRGEGADLHRRRALRRHDR